MPGQDTNWRFSWGASLSSGAIAIAACAFFGTLFANLMRRMDPQGMAASAASGNPESPATWMLAALSIATLVVANLLGGYLAARRSRNRPLMHALVAGAVCESFFVLMLLAPDSQPGSALWEFLMLALPMSSAVVGGWFVARRRRDGY